MYPAIQMLYPEIKWKVYIEIRAEMYTKQKTERPNYENRSIKFNTHPTKTHTNIYNVMYLYKQNKKLLIISHS